MKPSEIEKNEVGVGKGKSFSQNTESLLYKKEF